jgi:hypothetical protein
METSWMPTSERDARGLRPHAHWVSMPDAHGVMRLTMVWAVPDPLPTVASLAVAAEGR